ncbi:MAG: DUF882 domain-containing protein [Rhodospirillales bacterium]|nr:DUF882 domain-containing protein [Alphaproteobacteria bacterium]MCB1840921.1 DUF882 domain-containing protein [Alphaproteobacteria bacterium]MCB9976034.1 DUF882 domain-containing protein [Rhodospirillales bacterium]
MGLGTLLASVVPLFSAQEAFAKRNFTSWKIAFRHAHTGESFSGVYRVGDKYIPEAFERMNYVLRDFRTTEVFPMDPRVIDILSLLYGRLDATESYQILSGYRSPKTNAMLRKTSSGVARNSFHMYGQAIDIRIPGQSTKLLRNTALALKAGGVGYYPNSDFVHVDTGKVRSW